ncbi:hypothetical protein [Intestinibacter bartlettii]|uniref:hypothetical protein n=1 Tax=Intestinibacter bartlettii TaxID=261299 RepID=UPI0022E19311|nr:hypothetical protein [Intestinibacter bartlettii]
MDFTKAIKEISVSEDEYKDFIENNITEFNEFNKSLLKIENDINFKLFNKSSKLKIEFKQLLQEDFVYIKNKDIYYCKDLNGIFPDFYSFNFSSFKTSADFNIKLFENKFSGYTGRLINLEEAKYLYEHEIVSILSNTPEKNRLSYFDGNNYRICSNKGGDNYLFGNFNYDSYNIPIYEIKKSKNILSIFIKEQFIPEGLSDESEKIYLEILSLYEKGLIKVNNEDLDLNVDLIKTLFINKFEYKYKDEVLSLNNLKSNFLKSKSKKMNFYDIKLKYLNCEKVRSDIEPYDEKILQDPNRGHWDLWINEANKNEYKFIFDKELIARNPVADIKQDGIIGIDFGTKSTVVVYMEGKEYIMPMRIGMGNYTCEISSNQYENPTVMQFRDLEEFLKDYNEKDGRPDTKWEDLTISHTAYNSLINSSSDKYYSFLSDLKQWAGSSSKDNIRIRDEKTFNEILKPYIELDEDSIDPIELYAYYLGLYINNMRNGIYLNYILSFPVTYEKAIREKMISSFEKGIKKSLPETILNDDDIMKKFKVSFSTSEPAAYSISALTEYNIEPDENPIFYGVFDFGGGTTDFDFGIYKESEGRDRRRFDYVIEHFGAGGDRTLGGENLLELLSFEIFKKNQKLLREKGITFTLPVDCVRFKGSEVLLSNSQEAKLNTKQLMEKVRPLWEGKENIQELESGIISSITLFDKTGKQVTGIELQVDIEELRSILTERIEKGVINFFEALSQSFSFNTKDEKINEINIFLAGNSSKSQIVKDLFNKYIDEESKKILEAFNINDKEKCLFKLYPPLGTDEALDIQEKLGINLDSEIERPNCKTGVAFGLLKSRVGGRIKVVDKNLSDNEISFKYYLGYPIKGKFFVEIDRNSEYDKWYKFIDASFDTFELYYTSLPNAMTSKVNIEEVQRKMYTIDVTSDDEDVNVYIRFVDPSTIEYVVAKDSEIEKENYLSNIVRDELD